MPASGFPSCVNLLGLIITAGPERGWRSQAPSQRGSRRMQNYWQGVLNERLTRRRAIVATSATAGAAMLLAACGGGSDKPAGDANKLISKAVDTSKSARRGGTLKLVQPSD